MIRRLAFAALALALVTAAQAQIWRPGFRPGFQFLGPASVIFSDNFDRADATLETSANWTRVGGGAGTLAIRSNQIAAVGTAQTAYLSPDLGTVNHFAELTMTSDATAGPFIIVRAVDSSNFVGVRQNTTGYQVYKTNANVFTILGTTTQIPAVGDKVRLEAVGSNVNLILNDVVVLPNMALGSDNLTSTRTGLLARNVVKTPWGDNYIAGTL